MVLGSYQPQNSKFVRLCPVSMISVVSFFCSPTAVLDENPEAKAALLINAIYFKVYGLFVVCLLLRNWSGCLLLRSGTKKIAVTYGFRQGDWTSKFEPHQVVAGKF